VPATAIATAPAPVPASPGSGRVAAGAALIGVGAAALIGGGVALGVAMSTDSKLISGGFKNGIDMQNAFDRRNALNTASIVAGAIGGAAAIVGIVLVALPKPSAASEHAQAHPSAAELDSLLIVPGLDGATLALQGRW